MMIILLVILAAMSAVQPVSAGWIETLPDKTIIHVLVHTLPDPTDTSTANRADVAAVRAFRKRFPEIFAERYRDKYIANPEKYGHHNWDHVEVELHQFSGILVEGVEHDLLAIAGGTAPDVLYVNFRRSDNYIENGFLYPLDKPEDGYLTGMTKDQIDFRIHPKIWPVIRRIGPAGEKHVWAIPYGGALGKVLVFRKNLFDEKGIPYPTAEWTWDDLLETAKKLTDPKRGIFGLAFGRGKHESWHWITFLWSAGGDVMVYNEDKDEWHCVFDSPEAAVALNYYIRLCTEEWTDSEGKIRHGYAHKDTYTSGYQKWQHGEIGMMFEYIDEKLFSRIDPELTDMVPVPLGPTGKRGAELNSRMMGLFSRIGHPAVRDAAWEYIRFYDSSEAMQIKTQIMVEGGFGRFINPKYLRMFGYPEVIRLSPKGWSETFEIAIETGMPEPYGRNSNFAYDMMTFPIQKAEQMAMSGKLPKDPEQRLNVLRELLREGNTRANEEMIGTISPKERLKRDVSAVVVLISIAIIFVLVFRYVAQAFRPPQFNSIKHLSWGFRKFAWAYVLLFPALLTIFVWQYIPLIRGSMMAFQDYKLMGHSTLIGVQNFGDVLWNSFWWRAVWNAIRYSFLIIVLTFLPPIALAILLQEAPRFRLLFRTIYYLPAVTTGLVTILLWKQFYDPSEFGVLNAIILKIPAIAFLGLGGLLLWLALAFAARLRYYEMLVGAWLFLLAGLILFYTCASMAVPILFRSGETLTHSLMRFLPRLLETTPEPYRWLESPDTAMIACVLPMIWAGVGPGCLIYLAALKGIADDLYESADIDGANFIDKVMFVIFPILKPLIIINFVGVFISSWYGATGSILAMTGGGAETEVAGLHIFYKAFIFLKFGPATAMAWMLGFMLIGFTVCQLRMLSRVEFRTTGG